MLDIASAQTKLRKVQRAAVMSVELPTPERVVQAGVNFTMGSAVRGVEMVVDGQHRAEQIRVPRAKIADDPFDRLAARGQLDEDDDMNRVLKDVGHRYRRLHHRAGLQSLKAMDPTSGFTTAKGGAGLLGSEAKCDAFAAYIAASDAVTHYLRRVLDAIVLHGQKTDEVGRSLGAYCDKKICQALAMTFLRMALHELARHFDRVDREPEVILG